MTVENGDGQSGTWGETVLHLFGTFILFVALNFAIGLVWANIFPAGSAASSSGFSLSEAFYGFLTYGVALWLAFEGPRVFFKQSKIKVVARVGVVIALAVLFTRGLAIYQIISSLDANTPDLQSFAVLSVAIIGFQALCSLAAVWLFYTRHKEDRTNKA